MSTAATPKDRFTSLDALAVVRELRSIGPARVEKAFDAPEGGWSLSLRPVGTSKHELLLVPGRYAALLERGREHGEELSPTARELRRLLTGAIVRSVADPGAERYLEIGLRRSDAAEPLTLAVEFFGTGNLVVVRGDSIALVTHPRAWAHRTLRIGAPYRRPPARIDPWTLGEAEIAAELRRSRTDLASTLAARLALGGPLAEELVARAGLPSSPPAEAIDAIASEVRRGLDRLLEELGDRPRGYLYRSGDTLVDATPYRSHRWAAPVTEEPRPTFSEAAAEFFPTAVPPPVDPAEAEAERARAELDRLVARQSAAVTELANAVAARRDDADAVLAEYSVAATALAAIRTARPVPETIEVELAGRLRMIPAGTSPREVAQRLYEEAKRLGEKLEGARGALAETVARRDRPRAPARPVRAPSAPARGRSFWFERYRWFVTSEGAIVIAGRDAASNDLIVRRNLKDGDVYVHADLHGAASVIVKRGVDLRPVGEASVREACQWAVAFSKAWRAGYATGTAFWASPDQVSKSAASGEFVARGAWVIHGTKHFVRDAPLELALGPIAYEGQERWVAAPESAVRARGAVRLFVTPGEERERSAREEELVRELGVPRPLLQSLLPAGGLSIRRP